MDKLLNVTIFMGKLCLCSPFRNRNGVIRKLLIILQVVVLFYFLTFNLERAFGNSPRYTVTILSERVRYFIVCLPRYGADLLIRSGAVTLGASIIEVVNYVREASVEMETRNFRRSFPWLVLALVFAVFEVVNSFMFFIPVDFENVSELEYLTIPRHGLLKSTVIFLIDVTQNISSIYAVLFIVIAGAVLLEIHRELLERLESLIIKERSIPFVKKMSVLEGGKGTLEMLTTPPQDLERFVDNFEEFRSIAQSYSNVAGVYTLAVITHSIATMVQGLTSLVNNLNLEGYGYSTMAKIGVHLTRSNHAFALFLLAGFGRYMTARVEEHRERLMNFYAKRQPSDLASDEAWRAFNFTITWNWVMLAGECVEVNFRLFPLAIGTVLSYFLVVFQMQSAENSSKQKC